jgi:hypothetical protein
VWLGSLVILAALAPLVVQRGAFDTIDTAVKSVQATELARSGLRSMTLSYPGRDIDPDERFFPFAAPFVFLSAGHWQSIFSSFYAVLGGLAVPVGPWAVIALSALGVAIACASTSALGNGSGRPAAAGLLLLATPAWFYGLNPSETALALGCCTAAIAVALRIPGARGAWAAGLLLGAAALLRDETLLVLPGVLYARHLRGSRALDMWPVLAGTTAMLLAMGAVDHWWFERPMLAHLRHAIPGLEELLPRSRARLPHLRPMTWTERWSTIVEYWLTGFGGPALAVALAAWVALAHGLRRLRAPLVASLIATAAGLHVVDLTALLGAPRILAGLLRLAPFVLLAWMPLAGNSRPTTLMRLTWLTCGAYLAIVALTLNTAGGKAMGPRLIIGLWPLIAAAAVEVLASYADDVRRRRAWLSGITAACGLVLVIGSLVMELAVVLPTRVARDREDAGVARLIAAIGDRTVVMDDAFELEVVGASYFDRRVMLIEHPRYWKSLAELLAGVPVDSFIFLARHPELDPIFPGYRRVQVWEPGRFLISRWVREAASSP